MQQLIRYLVNNYFHTYQKRKQIIFICCCLLILPLLLHGQAYPVDCRVLLSPPYSGNWNDYANSPTKFRVQLLLRDLTKTSLEVSLRIRLKSAAGVWIENPESFITSTPISLTPGVPRIISGAELFDNFSLNNLEAQGIDLNALYQGDVLPVGPYQWEVLAIELYRNRQVSNIGSARMTINANYAPLLNLPRNETVLAPSQPQNILFSWTPRHTASPSLGVKYTLFLYEISDDDDNIQAVVNSGIAPYRIIETSQPNYLYGASEVPLQAGKKYAWQVKVEDLQGKEVFQNDGFSNIQSFSYGKQPCLAPENLISEIETEDGKPTGAVKFSWKETQSVNPITYILTYNQEGNLPTEVRTSKPEYLLIQQEAGKNYEWKVQSVCGVGDKSTFTPIETFNIPSPEPESWYSDPNLSYQEEPTPKADPEVMRTKEDEVENDETQNKEIENVNKLLNTPIKIFIPAEGEVNLPEGIPASLPILHQNANVEQLQTALKTKKPTCTGIVSSYSCGNHDTTPTYNGTIVPVNTGDEVAMNSLVLSIVSIDGSGNGSGLIKIPMMNNVKLGVTLSGIQVAEGGCIVAGRAELSGISASVLNEQQRFNLEKAYNAFNQAIDEGIANAGAIVETYNDIADLYAGMAKKTQAMLDKLNNGEKISQRDAKALEEMKKQATVATDKIIEALKTKFGSEGSEEFIAFIKSTTESCICSADIEKPKKGPNAEFYFSLDDDCKKCLEEQKKKQEKAAEVIKKVQKILIVKMQCGCFKLGNFLQDFGHDDKNCEAVINKVELVKSAIKTGKSLPTTDLTIQGQILIGSVCYTDLQVISIQGSLDPKKFEINSDGITFKNVLKFNITEADDRKMKVELLRKYLFEEVKEVEEEKNEVEGTSDLKYKSGREYGWLSASQESQNPCDIGYDKTGGCSYGKHQMAVKTGKIDEFIDWVTVNYKEYSKNEFKPFAESDINEAKDIESKSGCKTCTLSIEFKKLCDEPKFIGLAHTFISEKNYLPTYNKIMKMFGDTKLFKRMSSVDEEALKEMCYSLGVQHGGAFRIFEMALLKDYSTCSESQILDTKNDECSDGVFPKEIPSTSQKTDMTLTANSISMQEYIRRVYASRKLYVKNNRNTIADWKSIIKNRYKTEENSIIQTLY